MGGNWSLHFIQRKGVFGLITVMLLLLIYSFWSKQEKESPLELETGFSESDLIQNFLDSIKNTVIIERPTFQIAPFNPNFISDHKGYTLGMSPEEIDRLHNYRDKGEWVNSTQEFQKVTGVSDSLLTAISPFFKFPEWVEQRNNAPTKTKPLAKPQTGLTYDQKKDLNEATQEELMEVMGIGGVLSRRIVHYRSQIGGFKGDVQLKDIYGLNFETRERLLEKFTVKSPVQTPLIDLNEATVVDLLQVPYINYELARKVVDYRLTREGFTSFDQLAEIEGFPYGKMESVKLYLIISNP